MFEYTDENGDEVEVELPSRFEVCQRCEGRGSHVNPNIDGHGITAEEWDRDWDEDSREGYMTGRYDVPCQTCDGLRVERVVDRDRCEPALLARFDHEADRRRDWDAEDAHTRRMESGGYDY
jgi:hypothetical protein